MPQVQPMSMRATFPDLAGIQPRAHSSNMPDPDATMDSIPKIPSTAKPLFLIGPPCSGTEALANVLNVHSEILLTDETGVFLQLNELIEKNRVGVRAGILFGKNYHRLWAEHLRENAAELIEFFYERIAVREGKSTIRYWGEQHPHLSGCLPFVSELYPEATYVYVVRDPRDAIGAIAGTDGVPVLEAIDAWKRSTNSCETFIRTLPAERLEVVKYEDLVLDFESVLTDLLRKLDLGVDDALRQCVANHRNRETRRSNVLPALDGSANSAGQSATNMTSDERIQVHSKCRKFITKYGFHRHAEAPATSADFIVFQCNICGVDNRLERSGFDRERRSCKRCHSSVRTRSIIHLLSMELFGESLTIDEFPKSEHITGIGLSDWKGYADALAEKFAYVNTYYHKHPKFDICSPKDFDPVDFLIASEVFEHVNPPVRDAFTGAYAALKDGGVLILTTPFMNRIGHTIEHFPELHEYKLTRRMLGGYKLVNTTVDGRRQVFRNLKFHGGEGQSLEMRLFSRNDILDHLRSAGFTRVDIRDEDCPERGILWLHPWSTPMVARRG